MAAMFERISAFFGSAIKRGPEVYLVSRVGASLSETPFSSKQIAYNMGGTVATKQQLLAAAGRGANWSEFGWVAESDTTTVRDAQRPASSSKIVTTSPEFGDQIGVLIYGMKPTSPDKVLHGYKISKFSESTDRWNQ